MQWFSQPLASLEVSRTVHFSTYKTIPSRARTEDKVGPFHRRLLVYSYGRRRGATPRWARAELTAVGSASDSRIT